MHDLTEFMALVLACAVAAIGLHLIERKRRE